MTDAVDRSVLDELVEMMGGMSEIVDDIVATYLAESPPLVAAIAGDNSVDEVRIAAHTLKSSSRAVGAMRVGDLSETIEAAARDGNLDSVAEQRANTPQVYDEAAGALSNWEAAPA